MTEFNTNYKPQNFDAFKEMHHIKSKESEEEKAPNQISFEELIEIESDEEGPPARLESHSAEVIHASTKKLESSVLAEKEPIANGALINTAGKIKDVRSINDCLKIDTTKIPEQSNIEILQRTSELWESLLLNFEQNPHQCTIATIENGLIRIRNARNIFQKLKDLEEIQYALVHHENAQFFVSDSVKADHPNIHQYAIELDDDVAEHIQARFQEAGFQPQLLVVSNSRFNEFKTLATIYIQIKMQPQVEKKKKEETSEPALKETIKTQEQPSKKAQKEREDVSSKNKKFVQTVIMEEDIQRKVDDSKRETKEREKRIKEKDQKIQKRIRIAKEDHDEVTSDIESKKILKEWKEE